LPARHALEMATIMGARVLHVDHITGSLEVGKRADIIVVDVSGLHNWPHFNRTDDAVYARIIYAGKSSDVQDVMIEGRWLVRDRALLTLEIDAVVLEAQELAGRIDRFLLQREDDAVTKLLAIGGLQQEESFEIQVKATIGKPEDAYTLFKHPDVLILKHSHYRQYDTYFEFGSGAEYRIRHREDDFLDAKGRVTNVRTRLTMTENRKERSFEKAIMLSHSRYISEATHPLRFYREYLQPESERSIVKERLRWMIDYKGTQLYVNVDRMIDPASEQYYLELKSQTWSLTDAERKAQAIREVLEFLEIDETHLERKEYVQFAESVPVMS
ncbi:MAG: amidohydrolase family protein, partial [Chloroflexi bacterium]|nr:amidohydrolase family protein [Chloroflexota bacterium]